MVRPKIPLKKSTPTPDWLSDLLGSDFSSSCADHSRLTEKEKKLNAFCIQCRRCICKHCTSSSANHHLHTRIQIFQHHSNDVVHPKDIQQYFDCSRIQSHKQNGAKTIHLKARTRAPSKKARTRAPSKIKSGAPCEACGRNLHKQRTRFCSIACKISVVSGNSEDESNMMNSLLIPEVPDLSLNDESNPEGNMSNNEPALVLAESPEVSRASVNSALKPTRKSRKRKSIPSRAPPS